MDPLILDTGEPTRLDMLHHFVRMHWTLLWPPLLGGMAIYWLLPQPRKTLPVLGALVSGLALLGVGIWFARAETAWAETVLFYAFAGLAILGGAMLVTQRNPIHGALSFALVVLSTCGLFLLQAAPFLMAATIIIYAGAIVVTFLFVIMLAQQVGLANADQRTREPFLATVAGFVLLGALLIVLQKNYDTRELDGLLDKVNQVARAAGKDEVFAILGDPDKMPVKEKTLVLADALQRYLPHQHGPLLITAEDLWSKKDAAGLIAQFKEIHKVGQQFRSRQGSLQPAAELPLSPFGGTPPNQPVKSLPAANVAGLGRTLFTDHLLAVELAGTLLLVATIGAIAIAGRRTEGLR